MNGIQLDDQVVDKLVADRILQDIKYYEEYLEDNAQCMRGEILTRKLCPVYSYDVKEEDKKLRKMLKKLIRVHNFYSVTKYTSPDKL